MLLHEKLEGYNLILASASPRRRELLAQSGIRFTLAEKFECDESYPASLPCNEVAQYIATLKSKAYPKSLAEKDILLTADTVVIAENRILGKPADRAEAVEMLTLLSGREHRVITGVCIKKATLTRCFSVESKVSFRNLSKEEIEYYIDNYKPFDKAGAYGIQEWIGYVAIEGIEGSFFNVMGLPVQRLYVELEQFLSDAFA